MKRGPLKPKFCAQCGVEFTPRSGMQKHCSVRCRNESYRVQASCKECGEVFEFSRAYDGNRLFCSNVCSARWKSEHQGLQQRRKPKICKQCGTRFQPGRHEQQYCTSKCWQARQKSVGRRKETHRLSTTVWSLTVKGESLCRNCLKPAIHLHHLIPRSKSGEGRENALDNGIPLCGDCHRGWHVHTVTIYRNRLLPNEIEFVEKHVGDWWLEKHYPFSPDVELRRVYCIARGEDPSMNEHRYHFRGHGAIAPLLPDSHPQTLGELHDRVRREIEGEAERRAMFERAKESAA